MGIGSLPSTGCLDHIGSLRRDGCLRAYGSLASTGCLVMLASLRSSHKKLTDGMTSFPKIKSFTGHELISSYAELCLVDQYVALEHAEAKQFKHIGAMLPSFPLWTEYLVDVRGVGPAMAGVLITCIDIAKARYPSSLWKYSGYDVAADGLGRSRRKEHLTQIEYQAKDGSTQKRPGITFNPFLKTKLRVLADCFLRSGGPYREIYDNYKHRLEGHEVYGTHNDGNKDKDMRTRTYRGRRHQMALRYMIKMFLIDLYNNWRALENLPVHPPYDQAKLGLEHRRDAEKAETPGSRERAEFVEAPA